MSLLSSLITQLIAAPAADISAGRSPSQSRYQLDDSKSIAKWAPVFEALSWAATTPEIRLVVLKTSWGSTATPKTVHRAMCRLEDRGLVEREDPDSRNGIPITWLWLADKPPASP